jgi:hypothetical protein
VYCTDEILKLTDGRSTMFPAAHGDDGSVTIYLQNQAPGSDRDANWLPAPTGDFRPILRMYRPGQSVLDGTYPLPPIRRTK